MVELLNVITFSWLKSNQAGDNKNHKFYIAIFRKWNFEMCSHLPTYNIKQCHFKQISLDFSVTAIIRSIFITNLQFYLSIEKQKWLIII